MLGIFSRVVVVVVVVLVVRKAGRESVLLLISSNAFSEKFTSLSACFNFINVLRSVTFSLSSRSIESMR